MDNTEEIDKLSIANELTICKAKRSSDIDISFTAVNFLSNHKSKDNPFQRPSRGYNLNETNQYLNPKTLIEEFETTDKKDTYDDKNELARMCLTSQI